MGGNQQRRLQLQGLFIIRAPRTTPATGYPLLRHPAITSRCRIHHHGSYQIGGRGLAGYQGTAMGAFLAETTEVGFPVSRIEVVDECLVGAG